MVLLGQNLGVRYIARQLGRDASSVSREIKRNSGATAYSASRATQNYQKRRISCRRKRRLDDPLLQALVVEKLELNWSPEQISGRLELEQGGLRISYATIYRAWSQKLIPASLRKHLRRRGRAASPTETETRGRLHGYNSIHDRPDEAAQRTRLGDWECDTMRGALGKGCVATFVDRRSRLLMARRMPDRKSKTLLEAMEYLFSSLPSSLRRSFTCDHGNEFFCFREVEKSLGTTVYFADPYCPWQRATNENTNGLLRQYFPKKYDFLSLSDSALNDVLYLLNSRPRKCLGFHTPFEVFFSELLHLA